MALEQLQARIAGRNAPGIKAPNEVLQRVDRARERKDRDATAIEECWRFFRGDTYCYLDAQNVMRWLPTTTSPSGGGKEPHRVRSKANIVNRAIRHEVSATTQKVPGYEIAPSSTDPEDYNAANLAKQVALYLYEHLSIRRVTQRMVTYAAVGDMGFAWPYWDPQLGDAVGDVNQGDICIMTFGLNEVYWEPGLRFDESPYHCIDQALPLDEAYRIEGYLGGELAPDSYGAIRTDKDRQAKNLVVITQYLQRPTPEMRDGAWLTLANGRVIAGVTDGQPRPYPDGPQDEPCLLPLSYMEDPDSDRDLGLMRFMLDPQRTYQDAWSKILEFKNRALVPQIMAPKGAFTARYRPTDAPGAVHFYNPVGANKPEWETPPRIPPELFQIMEEARTIVTRQAAQDEPPTGVEAAKAFSAWYQINDETRSAFIAQLADFHAKLMSRCLQLVADHYNEKRLVSIRGRLGWEAIRDFKGANLRDQVDVRVQPGSLLPVTRDQLQAKLTWISQAFPGYLSPEVAIAALESGTGEEIVQDFEEHRARAWRIVQRIKDGTLMEMQAIPNPKAFSPPAQTIDPMTGATITAPPEPPEIPGWMPRPWDRVDIHKHVFESWFTSEEWELLNPALQHAAMLYYDALLQIEANKQAQELAAQSQMAEARGAANAARGNGDVATPSPSLPGGAPAPGGSPATPSPA